MLEKPIKMESLFDIRKIGSRAKYTILKLKVCDHLAENIRSN